MRSAQITCDDGAAWGTSVNGTDEEIALYFLRQQFEKEDESGMRTCTALEIDGVTINTAKLRAMAHNAAQRGELGLAGKLYLLAADMHPYPQIGIGKRDVERLRQYGYSYLSQS